MCLFQIGFAQTATPEPAPAKAEEDEPVMLSPFVVDASQDKGYRATATLAGSRINTNLKDVAGSVTVVTKEFITDLGAADVNDIVSYIAGMEGTRDFTATTPTLGRPSDGPSSNPGGSNRTRGLYAADITRDYFFSIAGGVPTGNGSLAGGPGFDTYNLDQVTFNRGPNSILAGLGSPAGIINYSPQMAGLERNRNEVSYRYGSFGDQRATINSNIVLKQGMLGLRVAAVAMDKGYQQQPAWNRDNRIYAAMTFKPWPKTTIRGSAERVKINSNIPNSLTPDDAVTQWVRLGKPSYDKNSTEPISTRLSKYSNSATFFHDKTGTIEYARNLGAMYSFNQVNLDNVGIWTPMRMSDDTYGKWHEVNVMPSTANQKLDTVSFSIDQEIVPNLNANVSVASEHFLNDTINLFRPEYMNYRIDVNKTFQDGSPNPHYGETYMLFQGLDNRQTDDNTNRVARATATYDLDLRKANKWFGHYRLTGFTEDRRTEYQHSQYNARRTSDNLMTSEIFYLGGTVSTPLTALPSQMSLFTGVPYSEYDAATNKFNKIPISSYYGLKSDAKQLHELSSSAVVLQAYLWDDKIVGLVGIRRDTEKAGYLSNTATGDFDTTSFVGSNYGTLSKQSATTKTYSVVAHPLKWLSLHYNNSENFRPNAGSIDLLGNPTSSPTGLGKDYGFSVSALDDKLNLKVNWFEITAANGTAGNPANFPLAQWNMTFLELTLLPEAAAKAGIPYKQGIAPGITVGDPRLANAYTSDNVSKGMEIEMTYNVTKNWRMMGSISKQEAKQTNIAPALTKFIEERIAYYKSANLWNNPAATGGSPWGLAQTGEEHFNQFLLGSYVGYKSVDGQPSTQLAKWHASGMTNYEFSEGALKGFNVGGGARYIDKAVIGNPAIRNASGTVTGLDLAHPYTTPAYISFDAWIGYRVKIAQGRVLSFQLNARDLQEDGGYRPIIANSDGSHAAFRIVQPRTFYLTTKLEF